MTGLPFFAITLTALFLFISPQNAPPTMRRVTLTGCVQATGNPSEFLLTVPADFPEAVRGIGKGQPVPESAGAGAEPRPNPETIPPRYPAKEPGMPEGRYSTPTMLNHSYRLVSANPSRLKPLIGQAIDVTGEISVEGFPSGDTAAVPRAPVPLNPPLKIEKIKRRGESCTSLIRSK